MNVIAEGDDLVARCREHLLNEFPLADDSTYQKVFEQTARVLHRKQQRHPIWVGEYGIGHRMVAAAFAHRIASGRINTLNAVKVIPLDGYSGTSDTRSRLREILAELLLQPKAVFAIDNFANLLRDETGQSNKALILSTFASSECRVLGYMTPRQYTELVADDVELQEHFVRIDLPEPNTQQAIKITHCYAAGLEQQFNLTIDSAAVEKAVVLSANYIFGQRLPGKAIKLLHRACENSDYLRCEHGAEHNRVTVEDLICAAAEISGVPEETLRGIADPKDYQQSLSEVIFGQPQAVQAIATELGLIKAGLADPGKPASVILLVGQTGTGKTELAKTLAKLYSNSKQLKTYTLGNFIEPHSVSGIIGVPPGYIGHEAGGRLVNDLNADPYGVFLLDEVDKAHPDVLQPFLNLFDEGWLLDQRGTKAYANHAIFVMTTNVGQKMIADMSSKGASPEEIADRMRDALSEIKHGKANRPVFSPEFLARIKRIVIFNSLDQRAMQRICQQLCEVTRRQWELNRGKLLEVPAHLIYYIAERAHDRNEKSKGKEGGRIVRKLFADLVESPLQQAITDNSDAYRSCERVRLSASIADGVMGEITVHFE